MKKIIPIDLKFESNMDADHLGHLFTECINQTTIDDEILNLIKVRFSDDTKPDKVNAYLSTFGSWLVELNIKNTIVIGLTKEVKDITVDHIKVVEEKNASEEHSERGEEET